MRRSPLAIAMLLAVSLAAAGCGTWQEKHAGYGDDLNDAVDWSAGKGGGVLRVARPDGLLWEGAAGYTDSKRQTAMTPATTFEVASVTKTFTATLVLMLAEDGRLSLDAPLGSLLPGPETRGLLVVDGHDYGGEITVRQLLAQTSGLPDYWWDPPYVEDSTNAFLAAFLADPERRWRPGEILAYVPGLTPVGIPGEAPFHYADTNYLLLGRIIETVDGRPLAQAFRARLFTPLGMKDTYLSYQEPAPSTVTESHRFEGHLDLHGRPHQTADWGGGGLVSSTRDLATFLFALAHGRVFKSPATLAAMQTWTPTGKDHVLYGLGLYGIVLGGDDGVLWGHDGYGGAFMYYWPKADVTLTGTLNQTEVDWWPLVERSLARVKTLK